MNKLTRKCVLAAAFFAMAFSPIAQASAAPFQNAPQNYSVEQGSSYGDGEQIQYRGHPGYNRPGYNNRGGQRYNKHNKYRDNRSCYYSHRRGGMVCKPKYRGW